MALAQFFLSAISDTSSHIYMITWVFSPVNKNPLLLECIRPPTAVTMLISIIWIIAIITACGQEIRMGLNYSTMGHNTGRADPTSVCVANNHYSLYLSPLWEENLTQFLCCGNHLWDCDELWSSFLPPEHSSYRSSMSAHLRNYPKSPRKQFMNKNLRGDNY